jgi:hypothetical protein
MNTNKKLIIVARLLRAFTLTLLVIAGTAANAEDFTKTYREKYSVDKGAVLFLQNKFGDIHCQLWDESSVSIEVTVKVDATSQERANKVFEKISVQLSGTPLKVSGVTSVGNISNGEFSIDYSVMMPRWMQMDLDQKFGNIYFDECDGTAKINLEYGSMDFNALNSAQNQITLKFSKAEAGFVKGSKLSLEYSNWESEGSENLDIYSRFSEVNAGKSGSVKLDSQYDEIDIEQTAQIISISRFSDLEIGRVDGDFDFDTEYGEVAVDFISAAFKKGNVRNSFAGVSLVFDPKASFSVDAELKFGDLTYPKTNASLNHQEVNYTTNIYTGRIGTSASPASRLTIKSQNAGASIRFSN